MNPSVLLVDDNAEVLGLTLEILRAAEMNVIAAGSAREAIAYLNNPKKISAC